MKNSASVMSKKLRAEITDDVEYTVCCFENVPHPAGPCAGRITREHAIIYAGKKIQERWAIIPCCAKHHAVDEFQDAGTMVKDMNIWVALNRATNADFARYDKGDFPKRLALLNAKYGRYVPPTLVY